MIPQERAEKIVREQAHKWKGAWLTDTQAELVSAIQSAIVEATNDEVERRRAAEKQAEGTARILLLVVRGLNATERDFTEDEAEIVYEIRVSRLKPESGAAEGASK